LHRLAQGDRLDRLKMCASDACRWIFYDRSKPGNRRWCSSVLCGNREKTRSYRGSGRLRTIKPMNVVDARRHWYSFVRIRRLPQLWPQGVAPTPSDRAPIPSWQGLIPFVAAGQRDVDGQPSPAMTE
jgi:CGNR zinc finger